ncbi:MAG: D-glycero-beta-D-manno-heptose 1,7-bisphosphate 7-phosphatase [Treponema sp.]|jgi:D-glycero-D-manno-heptose 1,7-bisphosphate phosphatase|nr:D-glycero-beta-D-manno-heptose 1,7-bisphosphate 7-phosphatase [Treponema sp.]
MKTVIMAGGRGTRIASLAPDVPKPMIRVCGKPILEHQIACLKQNNLTDILIITGHLGKVIQDYCGDGSRFGCTLSYYAETEALGTAGALFKIGDKLGSDFILINGDIIFDMDFSRFITFYRQKQADAALVVHPNSHPFDSALLISDRENRVIHWLNKEDPRLHYKNQVNAGVHILSQNILSAIRPGSEKIDLDREILKPQLSTCRIFAYPTPEYIKDVGTPERYAQVTTDMEKGLVRRRNLSQRQKAVFLDRDGTINTFKGFITKPEDFELLEGATEAIREINHSGYLAIVITNQPVIARGDISFEELASIHNKMETELGKKGAYLDDIFFCPHHPDKGFPGERPAYKIDCECRKPKPGMLLKAAEKYHIDLAASYMVGDSMRDVEAGRAAGCRTVLLNRNADADTEQAGKIMVFSKLQDFTQTIISRDQP